MKLNKAYPIVIGIVTNNPDHRALLIQIAKDNPQAILDAERALKPEPVHPEYGCNDWYKDVALWIKQRKHIHAIKELRSRANYSLRDSKGMCDSMRHFFFDNNLMEDE